MQLAERTAISLAYTLASICGPAIIVGDSFMTLWMGATFASHAGPVVEILMIGAWINGVAFIPFSLLQAQGRPDVVAKFTLWNWCRSLRYCGFSCNALAYRGLPWRG